MRNTVIDAISAEKLIVIVRGVAKEKLIPLAEAMYNGGIRLLEITYSSNGKVSDEDTSESIRMLSEHFEGRMMIGAGTVLTENQVALTCAAGGKFIISPNTDRKVIEKTRELGLVSMPGAFTPSEITAAYSYGADFVKLFPVTSLGPEYVKAVRAPLSNIPLLAVGGIDLSNMGDYLKAGVCGFGIGSNIIDKKMLAEGDFDGITSLAEKYVKAARG
jgi:2-dehydro-3-deoxyphosphogluconate aldolase/(4S)-4-hydroxy-2-oxoglutarate aldolase